VSGDAARRTSSHASTNSILAIFKEGTMLESTWRTQPVEQPTRLQLAIREWQRQLLEKARVTHSDGREPTGATTVEF
jgi:hypothetical protein